MFERDAFLRAYNIDEADFKAANIPWEELAAIYDDYLSIEGKLRGIGKEFVNDYLYDIERAGIHSYRYRTKSPGHLLEKIIRKRSEHPGRFDHIDRTNYHKYITDLIGIRVFFLYREDWIYFHNYITTVFENDPENYVEDRIRDFDEDPEHFYIAERPKVYRRNGDTRIYDEELIDIKSDGIYRSLHYIIKYRGYYVEIQGSTLFEEGWSEIDHDTDRSITKPFCCDLLSIAMGRAPAGCVWVTVMGNLNTLAVAALADAACVILAEGAMLDEAAVKKAAQQGITVLRTEEPVFETALAVKELLK